MRLFRLVKEQYASDMSGFGAEIAGGRWNRKGLPVVYTSENSSLAILETIVHAQHIEDLYGRILVEISVPEDSIHTVDMQKFGPDWNQTPWTMQTVDYGSRWLQSGSHLLMRVASAIDPGQYNVLINPRHRLIRKVRIVTQTKFTPDRRLRPER